MAAKMYLMSHELQIFEWVILVTFVVSLPERLLQKTKKDLKNVVLKCMYTKPCTCLLYYDPR